MSANGQKQPIAPEPISPPGRERGSTMCTFSVNTPNAAGLPLLRGPVRAGCVPDELERSMRRDMKRQCYTTRWDEVIRVTG